MLLTPVPPLTDGELPRPLPLVEPVELEELEEPEEPEELELFPPPLSPPPPNLSSMDSELSNPLPNF